MKKLKGRVYYEHSYIGSTVGALLFDKDTVLIDAPLRPEDGREWLSDLGKAGAKPRRLAINLDAHPDRTLGTQTLGAQVIAHHEVVRQFRRRATIFKAIKQESGAEWEETPGLSGLRWILPRMTFAESAQLYFEDEELSLEAHPGPGPGSCWLVIPDEKIVFVGDAVVIGEPPFLAQADIAAWLKQLDLLASREFRGYTVIAGRGGKATPRDIGNMRKVLKDVQGRLRGLAKRKNASAEIEKLAVKMAGKYKTTYKRQALFVQRLKHGMQAYFSRHYLPGGKAQNNH
jgi:glyoxylase-like metal-dependent hydrolase (beta-lactamase superfamily II)